MNGGNLKGEPSCRRCNASLVLVPLAAPTGIVSGVEGERTKDLRLQGTKDSQA